MRTHLLPSLATSESAMIESVDLTSGNCRHQRVSRRLLNQFALNGNILGLDEDIDVRFFFFFLEIVLDGKNKPERIFTDMEKILGKMLCYYREFVSIFLTVHRLR